MSIPMNPYRSDRLLHGAWIVTNIFKRCCVHAELCVESTVSIQDLSCFLPSIFCQRVVLIFFRQLPLFH